MNRDSILDPYITSSHDFGNCVTPEDAKAAMDKYAKQQAIAFGLWLTEGNWVKSESIPGSWCCDVDGEEYKRLTTNQLYDIFIELQNKQE